MLLAFNPSAVTIKSDDSDYDHDSHDRGDDECHYHNHKRDYDNHDRDDDDRDDDYGRDQCDDHDRDDTRRFSSQTTRRLSDSC